MSQRKILIIAPSWVGDAVMSLGLIQNLKLQDPDALIHVLVVPWCEAIYQLSGNVAQTILMNVGHGRLALKERWRLACMLKQESYDEAYVLPNSWKSALIPFLARIPKRVGYWGECRFGLLTHPLKKPKDIALLAQQYQYLAQGHSYAIEPRLLRAGPENLHAWGIDSHSSLLILCPGAEYGPAKRWPGEYFAQVSDYYTQKGWQVAILGSVKDRDVANAIVQNAQNTLINLTGKTTLSQAVEILSQAHLVVTNDSGLMHVAAALDLPTIAIFGSSSPTYTPPLSKNASVVYKGVTCSPCFQRHCPLKGKTHLQCLTTIKPEHIVQVAASMGIK